MVPFLPVQCNESFYRRKGGQRIAGFFQRKLFGGKYTEHRKHQNDAVINEIGVGGCGTCQSVLIVGGTARVAIELSAVMLRKLICRSREIKGQSGILALNEPILAA